MTTYFMYPLMLIVLTATLPWCCVSLAPYRLQDDQSDLYSSRQRPYSSAPQPRHGYYPLYGATPFVTSQRRADSVHHRKFKLEAPSGRRPSPDFGRLFSGLTSSSSFYRRVSSSMHPPSSRSAGDDSTTKREQRLFPSSLGTFGGPFASLHYDSSRSSYNGLPPSGGHHMGSKNKPEEAYHLRPEPHLQEKVDELKGSSGMQIQENRFSEHGFPFSSDYDQIRRPIQSRRRENEPIAVQPKLMVRDANMPDVNLLYSDSHHPYSLLYMHYLPNDISSTE